MMEIVSQVTLVTLAAAVLVAFIRLVKGPTLPDRIVASDLLGVLVVGLIVVLAAILLHGAVIMALTVRAASAPGDTAAAVATTRRTPAWYRREADALAEAGRYREAMQATFTALALELDQRGAVRFHPGKTPAEYAREARLGPADRESLGGIVRGLYGAVFGGAPVGRDEYLRWRDAGRGGWHAVAP
jgi:multicomponent Na+:H+ antiporter subunit F